MIIWRVFTIMVDYTLGRIVRNVESQSLGQEVVDMALHHGVWINDMDLSIMLELVSQIIIQ